MPMVSILCSPPPHAFQQCRHPLFCRAATPRITKENHRFITTGLSGFFQFQKKKRTGREWATADLSLCGRLAKHDARGHKDRDVRPFRE